MLHMHTEKKKKIIIIKDGPVKSTSGGVLGGFVSHITPSSSVERAGTDGGRRTRYSNGLPNGTH